MITDDMWAGFNAQDAMDRYQAAMAEQTAAIDALPREHPGLHPRHRRHPQALRGRARPLAAEVPRPAQTATLDPVMAEAIDSLRGIIEPSRREIAGGRQQMRQLLHEV